MLSPPVEYNTDYVQYQHNSNLFVQLEWVSALPLYAHK